MNQWSGRRAGIIAGLIIILTLGGRAFSGPADESHDEPSGKIALVYLRPAAPTPTVPRESLLVRELVRQAVLIAARDGLGLPTRDGTLREIADVPAGANPAHQANTIVLDMQVTRTANQVLHARLSEISPKPQTALWEKDFHLAEPDTYYKLPKLLTVQAEAASRTELVEALKRAGLAAQSAAPDPAAKVPDGVEDELSTLSIFPQFAALRQLHGAIATHGESPALLGALARAYANMGLITQMQWNAAHDVFAARSLLYAQRMLATSPDPASPIPLWHRAYAYTLAGLMAPAMGDLKQADKLQSADQKASPAPAWVALLDDTCQYNTSALLDAAAGAQPAQSGDITGLASYLGFLSVLDDSNQTTTERIARLAMAANPTCVEVLDDLCRVGGVPLNHELTVSAPMVFTTAIEQELPHIADLPAPVADAMQSVQSHNGSASSRAALAQALVAAGNQDGAEPSWGMLGRLVQDTFFAQTQRRAFFMAFDWGVGDADVADYAKPAAQLIGDHPYYPVIRAYAISQDPDRELAYLKNNLHLVDAGLSMMPLIEGVGIRLRYGPDHSTLWYHIMSHRDDTAWDLTNLVAAYRDPADPVGTKAAILLHQVSPESPSAMARMIVSAWDRVGDAKARQWEEESGNHPMVLAALAQHDRAAGHLDDAARLWERVVAIAPDPQGYRALAMIYLKQGNEARWLLTMKKIFTLEDNGLTHASAQNEIARHYMFQHRYVEAWPWAQQAAESWAQWAMETAGDCAEGIEDWKDAETWAQNESERYSPSLQWYLWCRRTGHGDLAAAKQAIQPALSTLQQRSSIDDLLVLGIYEELEHRDAQALAYYREALDRGPGWLTALSAAVALDEHSDAPGRDAALDRALKPPKRQTPAQKQAFDRRLEALSLIRSGYRSGKFDLPALDRTVANKAEQPRIELDYFIGRILIDKKQTDKGIDYLKRCVTAPPFVYCPAQAAAYDLLRRKGIDPMALEHELAMKQLPPTTKPAK